MAGAATMTGGNTARAMDKLDLQEGIRLTTRVDRPLLMRGEKDQEIIVKIDLEGQAWKRPDRMPLNLAVVLDRSGSMTGRKLEQAKQAAQMLVDQLTPRDVFSLVIYDSDVEVLISPRRVENKAALKRTISRIHAGGSTALYAGVKTGGDQLQEFLSGERVNRVMLLSDGLANVGPSSNREIAQLGHRLARQGIPVTTIGLGDDYNEDLMTSLAEASDANYYYVADVEALTGVFRQELGELQSLVARRLVLEIRCPEGVRPIEFIGRQDEVRGQVARVEFGDLAGEQNRFVLLRCQMDRKLDDGRFGLADVNVHYEDIRGGAPTLRDQKAKVFVNATNDRKKAESVVDRDVQVEAELLCNAAVTRDAIAFADAGEVGKYRETVDRQIAKLTSVQASAPAAKQEEIQREIDLLEENKDQVNDQGLDNRARKSLQWNVFRQSNSKASNGGEVKIPQQNGGNVPFQQKDSTSSRKPRVSR